MCLIISLNTYFPICLITLGRNRVEICSFYAASTCLDDQAGNFKTNLTRLLVNYVDFCVHLTWAYKFTNRHEIVHACSFLSEEVCILGAFLKP